MQRHLLLGALLTLLSFGLQGQKYLEMMNDPSVNFYDVQAEANLYFSEHSTEKGSGYKPYKRWEWYTEQRVYPSGNRLDMLQNQSDTIVVRLQNRMKALNGSSNGNWILLGPSNGNSFFGAGRVNCMASDPSNNNIVFSGAGSGGVWKSTDGGLNWLPKGDFIQNLGVSSIAIDPSNTSVLYLATGDYDGGATPSFGLLKSTDGGTTWNSTGLTFTYSQGMKISNVNINPSKTSEIVVVTNNGIYLSTNSGTSFTKTVASGNYGDLVRHPSSPSILYASTAFGTPQVYKSIDGGAKWSLASVGITKPGSGKIILAVTPAAPNNVYAAAVQSGGILNGFYVSTDAGENYTSKSTTMPGVMINQIGYDDCLAVSPTNANIIIFGSINLGRSIDGGITWGKISDWDNPHCDVHWLHYDKAGTLFVGNDGGMWKSPNDGTTWAFCNGNFTAQQYYGMGQSAGAQDVVMAGAQDNGFHYLSNGVWKQGYGGDAMKCLVDYNNPKIMVGLGMCGHVLQTKDGATTWQTNLDPGSGIPYGKGSWVTPICIDPVISTTYYIGFDKIWKSTNGCVNWTAISGAVFGGNIHQMAIAKTNNKIIFVSKDNKVYKSSDGGVTWSSDIAASLNSSEFIASIGISPTNSNEIWITKSGYGAGKKVYQSKDGGTTWLNVSLSLPNLPINTVAIHGNPEGGVYIAGDEGVYYKNNNMTDWIVFDAKLPNVIVKELLIYEAGKKLRACTYGRGVWESNLYTSETQTLEAENAALSGAVISNISTGFTGTGYADFQNPTNDYIEWSYSASKSGKYTIDFRYGLISESRPLQLLVNGTEVSANLPFPTTGSWTTWNYTRGTEVSLAAGLNKIRLKTIGLNGGNIDHLRIVEGSVPTTIPSLTPTELLIYPNPATECVVIELPPNFGTMEAQIDIVDINGNILIHRENLNDSKISIDVKSLADGIYVIKLKGNTDNLSKKFYVRHK